MMIMRHFAHRRLGVFALRGVARISYSRRFSVVIGTGPGTVNTHKASLILRGRLM